MKDTSHQALSPPLPIDKIAPGALRPNLLRPRQQCVFFPTGATPSHTPADPPSLDRMLGNPFSPRKLRLRRLREWPSTIVSSLNNGYLARVDDHIRISGPAANRARDREPAVDAAHRRDRASFVSRRNVIRRHDPVVRGSESA